MPINKSRHYAPKGSKENLIGATEKTTGAFDIFSKFISAHEADDPETLIDIKITNPLRRIYDLIADIKKHQSTTFSMKFTIPLIALPIFLLVAFQLGRGQVGCRQQVTSIMGVVKTITVEIPEQPTGAFSRLRSLFSFLPGNSTSTTYVEEERSVLISQDGTVTHILHPQALVMSQYVDSYVLATGNYSSCTNVITVVSEKNIDLL